jgi:hypothetical protein
VREVDESTDTAAADRGTHPSVELESVTKRFAELVAVRELDLRLA